MVFNKPFGHHLMIDADKCEGDIRSREHIQNFINQLVDEMGMKKMGETKFIYFENNEYNADRDTVGYTGFQCISLSNITMHINEISKTIYLDVFSCSTLDDIQIALLFSDYFKPMKMKKNKLTRDAKS